MESRGRGRRGRPRGDGRPPPVFDQQAFIEAMGAIRITLASFQLEGVSQILWEWVTTSRDLDTMTWNDFSRLFMGKYFLASAIHAKAREFLKLRQGAMIVLEYVARFTELARFRDDYVATNEAKVRKFKDGLKLSIRGKIVGHNLQDMDLMVSTALIIE